MFRANSSMTRKELLSRVVEEDVFLRYANLDPREGLNFRNPLRDDNNPGCRFFRGKDGSLLFHDFSLGQTWTCISMMMQLHNLKESQAIELIQKDFNVTFASPIVTDIEKKWVKKEPEIVLRFKSFSEEDLLYWKEIGVTKHRLEKEGIRSVDTVYVEEKTYWRSTEKNPIYFQPYGTKNLQGKLYRPFAKKNDKWLTVNKPDSPLMGLKTLESSDLLIITKSLKDVLVLKSLGYQATCPPTESANLEGAKVLKTLYKKIIIFFDNDVPGKIASHKNVENFTGEIFIPTEEKDISDYYKKHGRWKTKQLMWTLLNPYLAPYTKVGTRSLKNKKKN